MILGQLRFGERQMTSAALVCLLIGFGEFFHNCYGADQLAITGPWREEGHSRIYNLLTILLLRVTSASPAIITNNKWTF